MEFVRKKLTDVIPAPYNPRSICDMLPPINGVGFLLHSCSIH